MAEKEPHSPDKKSGCGLFNAVFGKRNKWPRRTTSTGSLQENNKEFAMEPSIGTPTRRRSGSDEAAFLGKGLEAHPPKPTAKPANNYVTTTSPGYNQNQARKGPGEANGMNPSMCYVNGGRRVRKDAVGISGELDFIINDYQKTKGSANLVRASSSNVMIFGNLGNLRQPGGGHSSTIDVFDSLPKTAREDIPVSNGKQKNRKDDKPLEQTGSLCRALSTRMDPETLKAMGNEDYKNGNFAEALALYDAAIAIDPNKASYRSNKSAALTALGKIIEAVFECREAIRIEPRYHRAHNRLANLYLRLGDIEKAMYHYKHAGPDSDPDIVSNAKIVQNHLYKCTEARRQRDWHTLTRSAGDAIAAGADAAPHIYALQTEALLKLHKYQDADEALAKGPKFEVEACTKFFGAVSNATILATQAQVYMVTGRLDHALEAAKEAARLDSGNREVNTVLRRVRCVAAARSNGNSLFKAARFSEACEAYGAGLDHDPHNSVLLCNRAACRSKLGQYDKALEDCSAALNARPSYAKARLRRADCYAKLEKWEAAKQDYEILQRETPGDEEVSQGLIEARRHVVEKSTVKI